MSEIPVLRLELCIIVFMFCMSVSYQRWHANAEVSDCLGKFGQYRWHLYLLKIYFQDDQCGYERPDGRTNLAGVAMRL